MIAFILILITSLFYPGIINRTKSIASGRKGPKIIQPLKDIWVLFHKGSVFSPTTSFIFQIAPIISLASVLTAMLMLPLKSEVAIISFSNDFVMFAYLLAFGKFFIIISALDTGSGFEGMGANREALYHLLIEPAFFILIATLGAITGYTSFSEIFAYFEISNNYYLIIIALISCYLLLQISMIENSRLPVDDPKTHLELTMIHEVMILDNSGFDKAIIHISSMLKFAIYGSLIFNLIIPSNFHLLLQIPLFVALQIFLAVIIGFLESFRARNKMRRNAIYIFTLSAISILAFFLVLVMNNKI